MNITKNRFIECIKKWNLIIKKKSESRAITLNSYWVNGNILAMFFDYEQEDKKEYVKIYLDDNRYSKPLRVDVYLLGRGERCGKTDYRDLLIKTFSDMGEFKLFLENLETEIFIQLEGRNPKMELELLEENRK